ncbi:hypothetical protein DZF97_15650, partial [Clavibacter nebraskensis]
AEEVVVAAGASLMGCEVTGTTAVVQVERPARTWTGAPDGGSPALASRRRDARDRHASAQARQGRRPGHGTGAGHPDAPDGG